MNRWPLMIANAVGRTPARPQISRRKKRKKYRRKDLSADQSTDFVNPHSCQICADSAPKSSRQYFQSSDYNSSKHQSVEFDYWQANLNMLTGSMLNCIYINNEHLSLDIQIERIAQRQNKCHNRLCALPSHTAQHCQSLSESHSTVRNILSKYSSDILLTPLFNLVNLCRCGFLKSQTKSILYSLIAWFILVALMTIPICLASPMPPLQYTGSLIHNSNNSALFRSPNAVPRSLTFDARLPHRWRRKSSEDSDGNDFFVITRYQRRHASADQIFPLLGSVFLPHAINPFAPRLQSSAENGEEQQERHLATIESVMPIIDVAIADAERLYLPDWRDESAAGNDGQCGQWLCMYVAPISQCELQKRAAWAALEALQWTNGSGLDVSFGPACDYVLATIMRILSFHRVNMFTNAGFSEFFQVKKDMPLTRVGPLQEHVSKVLEEMFHRFSWKKSQLLYEKTFWESELREAGFCKILMNGLYFRSVERKWPLQMDARIVPHAAIATSSVAERRAKFKAHLVDAVGNNYGGWCPIIITCDVT